MDKWYNEKKQASTIDIIFNQIILKKFGQEYENPDCINMHMYVNNYRHNNTTVVLTTDGTKLKNLQTKIVHTTQKCNTQLNEQGI